MGKRANEFTLRRGNCATTFEFGPKNALAFSTRTEKVSLPLVIHTTTGLSGNLRLEVAPTITWNEDSGEVRIRDSYRAVDNEDKPLDPAVYVARVLRLKAGQFVFEKPYNGPDPHDITMQFLRPDSTTWPEPVIEIDSLPAWTSQSLTMSKHLGRWVDVSAIKVTFHCGQDNRFLPMDRLMTCREKANQALLSGLVSAPSTLTRRATASSSTTVQSIPSAPRAPFTPRRRAAAAATSRRLPAHMRSTDWLSPAAASHSDPAPQRALPSLARASVREWSGEKELEQQDESTLKAAKQAFAGNGKRLDEDDCWVMVVRAEPET